MPRVPQLKGPKIQRDVALLIRLLWRLEGWGDPTTRSALEAAQHFVGLIGCLETCDCGSCANLISATKTTAAILEPHLQNIVNERYPDGEHQDQYYTPDQIQAHVYSMLGKYLMTSEEYGGPSEEG